MSYQAFKDDNRLNAPKNRPWKVAILKGRTWDLASEECKLQFDKFINSIEKQGVIAELVDIDFLNDVHAIHENIYNKSLSYYFEAESKKAEVISSVMSEMIRKGKAITAADYVESLQRQSSHTIKVDQMLSDYDVGISLSTGSVAPLRNEAEVDDPSLIWTLTHLPALNVPLFKSNENLPFGVQVVSRKYNDYKVLNFVEQFSREGIFPVRSVMDGYDFS
jgi:Asp-tRNA(Asn)/Glu-tRNA(Gln) amidotransferase A subunit family amidase